MPGHGSEVAPGLLRLWCYTGQYLAGAFAGDTLVGASVAFLGDRPRHSLHSHITGVTPGQAGRGIGMALKRHQRDWARDRDIGVITWTFDPLVARNAYFNLTRLGARPVAYLPDFYGEMPDAVNAGTPSDRLFVRWQVTGPVVPHRVGPADPTDPEPGPVLAVLTVGVDGEPVRTEPPPGVGPLLVGVPGDIEALRRRDPAQALRWRWAVRDALAPPIDAGARVRFRTGSGYVIETIGDPPCN